MAETVGRLSPELLEALSRRPDALRKLHRGIEKESLRICSDGSLSQQPHPRALGSALTHPHITTDFSEAQLELITAVHEDPDDCLRQLELVHRYVYQHLEDELLWTSSMPCLLSGDSDIPVGRYGSSNIGMAKTVYRRGLGNRYGRLMQTISGIHYNFSVPDDFWQVLVEELGTRISPELQTARYFGLIRNFRRFSWLLIYLFGASPAICRSFVKDNPHALELLDEGSLYLPYATSLRMGRLGYQSDAQSSLHISYNSLDEYAVSMRRALTQPYPPYEAIGVEVDGEYRQLNTAILQIENEFYGTIRPKRPIQPMERPLTALEKRGVEYVEVRCLDLNPFLPMGIDNGQTRFLDVFLLYCLLSDSPPDSKAESAIMQHNQLTVVEQGRKPDVMLQTLEGTRSMTEWAEALMGAMKPLVETLDEVHGNELFGQAWEEQMGKIHNAALTPSARVLAMMESQQIPFFRFALNQSNSQKGYFEEHPLREQENKHLEAMAAQSHVRQAEIEQSDDVGFDQFLGAYLDFQ